MPEAKYVALTGVHWTLVSNHHNYRGVTAHIFDSDWKLQSFALTMLKMVTLNSFCLWQRHGELNIRLPQLEQTVLKTWEL